MILLCLAAGTTGIITLAITTMVAQAKPMTYYTLVAKADGTYSTIQLVGALYPNVFELHQSGKVVQIPLPFDGRKQIFADFIRALFNPQTLSFKPLPTALRQLFARRVRDPAFKDAVQLAVEGIKAGNAKLQSALNALQSVGTMSAEVLQVLETLKTEFTGQDATGMTPPAAGELRVFFSINPALAKFDAPDTVEVTLLKDNGKGPSVTGVVDSFANTPMVDARLADKVQAPETGIIASIKGVGGWIKVPIVSLQVRLGKGGIEMPVKVAKVPDLPGLVGYDFLISQGMRKYAQALGRSIA